MKQILIGIDQLVNTFVWARDEGFGFADETLSARAWRLRDREETWGRFQKVLDLLFFWDKHEGKRAHTYLSWVSEFERHQLPDSYLPHARFHQPVGIRSFKRRTTAE